jgi:hypothetical protein
MHQNFFLFLTFSQQRTIKIKQIFAQLHILRLNSVKRETKMIILSDFSLSTARYQ